MIGEVNQVREKLEDLLVLAGLSSQTEVMAMHLAEIEDEIFNVLDQFVLFRAHARHQDVSAAQETLVELSVALQHLAGHVQALTPILDAELGIDSGD